MTIAEKINFIENYLLIVDKSRKVLPFKLNRVQRYYMENKSRRTLVLKSRQLGLSSIILADIFVESITVPNTTCVIVSHEQHATERLLSKVHFFYETLQTPVKPEMGHSSASEITFPELNSSIYIGTARSMTFGRGDTINKCHLCLHPDSLVLLKDGMMKAVKDIIPQQDKTYSYKSGGLITVAQKHVSTCSGTMIKATIAYNPATPLIATPDHKVLGAVNTTYGIWKPLEKAKWIGSPIREITGKKESIALEAHGKSRWNKVLTDRFIPYSEDFGWIVGLFLAEGSYTAQGITFSLSPEETEYANTLKQFFSFYGASCAVNVKKTCSAFQGRTIKGETMTVTVYSTPFKKVFLKLVGEDKHIPDWFWSCGVPFLKGVADGYIAGDGSKDGYVTSVRPWLLYQLRAIQLSLGRGYSGISRSDKRNSWVLYPVSGKWVKFRKIRGKPFVFVKIQNKVTVPYTGDMYDLETRGSFMTPVGIVHNSEVAFYDDPERIINAVEEAVPLDGEIVAETSPNGENLIYDMWGKSREGRNSYKPLFFPWWMAEDYMLPKGSEYALEADRGDLILTPEEQDLVNMHGLSEEQLRWRRMKIADKGGLFYQEYPEDEINCFITVGEPVFDSYILDTLAKGCYPGKNHSTGAHIWKEPEKDRKYIIGADCSAGDVSYSAAAVIDEYYNVCATFMRKVDPTVFAHILEELGRYYNNAELVVERNAQGYAVLAVLEKYPNKYYQRDYTTGKQTSKVGWWTNEQTKSFMFSSFKDVLPRLKVWDINLVRQAKGYRYVGLKPTPQTYDDLLIATMIAIAAKRTTSGSRGIIGFTRAWND